MSSELIKSLDLLSFIHFRIEQQYQNVLTLWHESHINMKSVVSWHYLINEIDRVRASNVASVSINQPSGRYLLRSGIKLMLPLEEYGAQHLHVKIHSWIFVKCLPYIERIREIPEHLLRTGEM